MVIFFFFFFSFSIFNTRIIFIVVPRWQGGETKYDICALNELFSLERK